MVWSYVLYALRLRRAVRTTPSPIFKYRTFLVVPVPGSLLSALTTVLVALVQPKIDLRRLTQGFDLASQLLDLLESVRQNLNLRLAGAPHG